ncbi:MAG: hypothetical protein GY913_00770 [Proteobacteria bacterium]|nr:hypothetical protein [Pseudomonadota bacterium]
MALSTVVKAFGAGSLTLSDGTGTPVTLAVTFDKGDFSASGFEEGLRSVAPAESRGIFKGLYYGDRGYIEGSFTVMHTQFAEGSGTGTPQEFCLNIGAYAANISTGGSVTDTASPYTIDMIFTIEGTDYGDGADSTFTLTHCRCKYDFAEGQPDMGTFSFTSYGAPTGDLALLERP